MLYLQQKVRGHHRPTFRPLSIDLSKQLPDGGEGMVIVLAPPLCLSKLRLQFNYLTFNI